MQVVRRSFLLKANGLSTVAQNTSCSRGWLRLLVQTIFALITVASFILILHMAIYSKSPPTPDGAPSRCLATYCRIRCIDAPYYNMFEEDIVNAITFTAMSCQRIYLELVNAKFENATLPINRLSGLRGNIYGLGINRGNLNHLPPGAFMSQFMANLRILILHHLTLRTWTADSFVSLSNLEVLHVYDCYLPNLRDGTLRTIEDSLQQLTIRRSGHWNPANMIGSTNLASLLKVDFSLNYFGDIIGAGTFRGLTKCKILYLNSCKITAIGAGAFDHLHNIEVLYLSSNFLVTIPPGLFNNIMLIDDPKPQINLQDNLWHCDCSETDLRLLVTEDMLLVDPLCVSPAEMYGITFTRFHNYCTNRTSESIKTNSEKFEIKFVNEYEEDYIYVNGSCHNNQSIVDYKPSREMHPMLTNKCSTRELYNLDYHLLAGSPPSFSFHISAVNNSRNMKTERRWIAISFSLETESYSVAQIDSSGYGGYGLLWYQFKCPDSVYCIKILPKFLKIYQTDDNARYTFCPVQLETGYVETAHCVGYDMVTLEKNNFTFYIFLYILIAVLFLLLGATSVYALIRTNPTLLKGSKRILFVKHKCVDALVMPPKIPLRSDFINDVSISRNDKNISIISNDLKPLSVSLFQTQRSVRSNKSNAPSYVSALQPTEDQLAEWRIRHHFNNFDLMTISSTSSEPSIMSAI